MPDPSESHVLHELFDGQLCIPQNLSEKAATDHLVVGNSDGDLSGTGEPYVAASLTHFLVANSSKRIDYRSAGKDW